MLNDDGRRMKGVDDVSEVVQRWMMWWVCLLGRMLLAWAMEVQ